MLEYFICGLLRRHRWTGRYEAHLWDNSCRREGQARKGRQGSLSLTLLFNYYYYFFWGKFHWHNKVRFMHYIRILMMDLLWLNKNLHAFQRGAFNRGCHLSWFFYDDDWLADEYTFIKCIIFCNLSDHLISGCRHFLFIVFFTFNLSIWALLTLPGLRDRRDPHPLRPYIHIDQRVCLNTHKSDFLWVIALTFLLLLSERCSDWV